MDAPFRGETAGTTHRHTHHSGSLGDTDVHGHNCSASATVVSMDLREHRARPVRVQAGQVGQGDRVDHGRAGALATELHEVCLLYTSDAADE